MEKIPSFENFPVYEKGDLGLSRNDLEWTLKVWSPYAKKLSVELYRSSDSVNPLLVKEMSRLKDGIWKIKISHKADYSHYTLQIEHSNNTLKGVMDPYAKVVSLNGEKAVFALPNEANPPGWTDDVRPKLNSLQDIILYELHIRDFSIDSSSGLKAKGKFMAFTERDVRLPDGSSSGLDHLVELGVTHVHLLPAFDFRSIDESQLGEEKFNWGYDPLNYNVPEGSYSSNPDDPLARILEFKSLVMQLHRAGIRVIMDVVYNHTGLTENSNFNQLVPEYYYRQSADGGFSNASACGNETASERPMMRKFMVESLKFWVQEYHIDGFRFDLMGIHDLETMDNIAKELKELDPSIFLYGEGWTAGPSPLPAHQQAVKANALRMPHIAVFSDDMRDGIKGSVFEYDEPGFASGSKETQESVKFGIVGSIKHPQVNYAEVNYSSDPWALTPDQCINYVSCHDNHTLWDKLEISRPDASEEQRIEMHKLANTIVLTSQGIPFLHGGVELLRTKNGNHNSFESPDEINSIKWARKTLFPEVFQYYKGVIQLRKQHPAFRISDPEEIRGKLIFIESDNPHLIGYWLKDHANGDSWKEIGVFFNGGGKPVHVDMPEGNWQVVIEGGRAGLNKEISGDQLIIAPYSASIVHR